MKLLTKLNALACIFFAGISLITAQTESGSDGSSSSSSSSGGGGSSVVGMAVGQNYVLKASDVIQVAVYQEEDLSKQVRVEGDGTVSLALVGKIKVAGMTVAESQGFITDLYNRDYLVDPQVSVLVVSFAPKFVRVLGFVGSSGVVEIPPDRELTLIDAITQRGGIAQLGDDRKITISRADADGRIQSIDVNFKKIRVGDAKDIVLQEGDIVNVPERLF